MEEKRKEGIEPTKEDNTQTQNHSTIAENICLFIFAISVLLIVAGAYTGNKGLMMIGLGAGGATGTIIAGVMTESEDK